MLYEVITPGKLFAICSVAAKKECDAVMYPGKNERDPSSSDIDRALAAEAISDNDQGALFVIFENVDSVLQSLVQFPRFVVKTCGKHGRLELQIDFFGHPFSYNFV